MVYLFLLLNTLIKSQKKNLFRLFSEYSCKKKREMKIFNFPNVYLVFPLGSCLFDNYYQIIFKNVIEF
jgi:hypothetical protein